MCTYHTEKFQVTGSGKGAHGWFPCTDAIVYFDHPVHAPDDHTLNIDLLNPARGASARVAVELSPASGLALARAIMSAIESAPPGLMPADAMPVNAADG